MLEHLTQNWTVRKPVARSPGGVVAAQNRIAAEVGARTLAEGGNAVDAAVAAGFSLAAVEPWNSGLGGVGYMLIHLAREQRTVVVDFAPISPRGLDPAAYPLSGGVTPELFSWPSVEGDRNVHGPLSFAVPGQVDGLGLAVERFGTRTFGELLEPAIALGEQGIAIDWYLTLRVATLARELARYPATREIYLPQGWPPVTPQGAQLQRLHLAGLADTLRRLAKAGRRDFYEGEIAARIAHDVAALGGVLAASDLRAYEARVVEPLECRYRDATLALAPGLTAGPSMARALHALQKRQVQAGGPHADDFVAYAEALREVYAERLQGMGEIANHRDPSCTTHLNVVDSKGNMVSLTQTLLSIFGSKVVLPATGILMNNGIMWFDPRPGNPNSLAPGKRPLTNMCPVIARRDGQGWFAIGASGGRKIMPAVLQISSFLIDHGMCLEEAFHQPRIDASGGERIGVDPRLDANARAALAAHYPIDLAELVVLPTQYACPSAVLRDPHSGEQCGIGDVMSPWSGAVAQ